MFPLQELGAVGEVAEQPPEVECYQEQKREAVCRPDCSLSVVNRSWLQSGKLHVFSASCLQDPAVLFVAVEGASHPLFS